MDFGSSIEEIISEESLKEIKLKKYGYPDEFIKHGSVSDIEKKYGIDAEGIVEDVLKKELCIK